MLDYFFSSDDPDEEGNDKMKGLYKSPFKRMNEFKPKKSIDHGIVSVYPYIG